MSGGPPALALPATPAFPVDTPRLQLRRFRAGDAAALLAFQSRPEVVRFVPYPPRTATTMRAALERKLAGTTLARQGDSLDVAVTTRDGQLIGDLVLIVRSQADATLEVGYIFDPRYGGRGYATEAVTALVGIAFGVLGAHRVVARVDERNTPSRRVCERVGLRQEACLVEGVWFKGEWTTEVGYGLLAREWSAPPPPAR